MDDASAVAVWVVDVADGGLPEDPLVFTDVHVARQVFECGASTRRLRVVPGHGDELVIAARDRSGEVGVRLWRVARPTVLGGLAFVVQTRRSSPCPPQLMATRSGALQQYRTSASWILGCRSEDVPVPGPSSSWACAGDGGWGCGTTWFWCVRVQRHDAISASAA